MDKSKKEMVSTGQAAKLCAVTPDTILKWIKKSKIEAIQTAGGHYRIDREVLMPFITSADQASEEALQPEANQITYCWEYHAKDGHMNENCRECMIFKSKAEKCYLMAGLGEEGGHAGIYCKNSCYECEYFHFINKKLINVLVITENNNLQNKLQSEPQNDIIVKFSCCGYDTATIIQNFNPDFIVLDETLVNSSYDEICKHLIKDPKLHKSQVVLAISTRLKGKKLQEGICATIHLPFSISDLAECFGQLRKNMYQRSITNN
jgi:excisionase family DNA binding protein